MKHALTIGWLYPDLMSTYGDRGNVIALEKRCGWRDIATTLVPIGQDTPSAKIQTLDLLFGGGAQDREQGLVMKDLYKKRDVILQHIEQMKPALFVCGAPQLMGKYYEPSIGKRIEGLGIFDITTRHPGQSSERLIGNTAAEVNWDGLGEKDHGSTTIIGFENHGGRTFLGKDAKPFAYVLEGFGNNGEDKTEGVMYKNAIGCYFHGPLLPKNPEIADWIIKKALEIKYQEKIELAFLDDSLEKKAHDTIVERLGISV
ncbi:MAG: cobalamin biosynthesis protein CobQ [Candidatus Levybacteria bacterium]|nr:cobalamin biosynthesis protein CobQ [Candidatus Levybacteria bacterium]